MVLGSGKTADSPFKTRRTQRARAPDSVTLHNHTPDFRQLSNWYILCETILTKWENIYIKKKTSAIRMLTEIIVYKNLTPLNYY